MVRPLDESQGYSPLQGQGSWLMYEVALGPLHGVPWAMAKSLEKIVIFGLHS